MPRALQLAALASACVWAQAAEAAQVLVVGKRQPPSLFKVDDDGGRLLGRVPIGVNGHEVLISSDGRRAYVPIYGDGALGRPGTDGSTIEVFDTATLKRLDVIELYEPVRPHSVVERRGLLWVTAEKARALLIINPRTKKVVGRVPTGQTETHSLALSSDGRRIYTANVADGSISVIDAVRRRLVKVIPVARRIQRVTLSPNGRMIFTHDTDAPRVGVIDARTLQIARWIALPDIGYASAATFDGKFLLVGSPVKRRVHLIDLRTGSVARSVEPDCDAAYLAIGRGDRHAYLSCSRDGKVTVLDLATMSVKAQLPLEPGIEGLAVTD